MKKGFTLVEVMIVVAIIGLLAAIGIPSIMNAMANAEDKAKDRNVAAVEKAKGMLQLPSTIHSYGADLTVGTTYGATGFTEADLVKCMQGVGDVDDLIVGGDAITVNAIGTTASY